MIINISVGNNHTMEIPSGMQKLLEEFFSTLELDGELNFLLAKKLKGRCSLVGSLRLVSINHTTRILTINAQPGGNNTRHELTTQIPNAINSSNLEHEIIEQMKELRKPEERKFKEETIFQKCLKLFYALDGKLRPGISEKKLHNGDYETLEYKNFKSLYYSVLRPAIGFKFLISDGQKGNTAYVWTPHFLAKKDEYEKSHLQKNELPENSNQNTGGDLVPRSLETQTEKPSLITVEDLNNMSDDQLTKLFVDSDEEFKKLQQELQKFQENMNYFKALAERSNEILENRKQKAEKELRTALSPIVKELQHLSESEILEVIKNL